jgi:hypothetical protein
MVRHINLIRKATEPLASLMHKLTSSQEQIVFPNCACKPSFTRNAIYGLEVPIVTVL